MRNVTGESITIDQAADLIESSKEINVVEEVGVKVTWREGPAGEEFMLIEGLGGEFVKLS